MSRRILTVLVCITLLYSFCIHWVDADNVDLIPVCGLSGKVYVDFVAGVKEEYLTPTTNPQHEEYTLVLLAKKNGTANPFEETVPPLLYKMGTTAAIGDNYTLKMTDDYLVRVVGTTFVPIAAGDLFKVEIYIGAPGGTRYPAAIGDPLTEVGVVCDGVPPSEVPLFINIPPGQPQGLDAFVGTGSAPDLSKIDFEWTASGNNGEVGTVDGYLAKISGSDITDEAGWAGAVLLDTSGWLTPPPKGPGQSEMRTASVSPPMTYGGTYYVALRAADVTGEMSPIVSAKINMPPSATGLSISPSGPTSPRTTDPLTAGYTYTDPEPDPEVVSGRVIKWYRGGVEQTAYSNMIELPFSATAKGQDWKFSVQTFDGNRLGTPVESSEVTILNTPPVANANGPYSSRIDSTGTTVLPIIFNGAGSTDADGDSLTYSWDYGDGGTGTGVSPTHTYPAEALILYPRIYSVSLTVNDGEADSDPDGASATITINQKPVADANGPYEGIAGEPLLFDGSGSSDPDSDPLTYAWNFGDGKTGTGVSPENTYDSYGSYSASLVVSDPLESSSPGTADVMIYARPVAEFSWDPEPQNEGLPIDFTDLSTDEDGEIVAWSWDFDNSDGIQVDSIEQNPAHTYMDDGSYVVTLTVTDNTGAVGTGAVTVSALQALQDSVEHTVNVNDLGPTAEFTWDPEPQVEGSAVVFTDASTSSPDDIASWAWDFDDGGTSDLQSPSHIFMDDGTYTVELTVTDDDGSTSTVQHDVTITDAAPTAAFTSAPEPQAEGSAVAFTDASTSPADAIDTWAWDFDDGETSTDQNPSHPFMDNGTYTVELTVTDDDGSTDTITHDVTITDAAPTAEFTWSPDPPAEGVTIQFTDASTTPADAIVSWAWVFGDGGTSTDQNPANIFTDDGTYVVSLTVTDDDGSTDTVTHDVIVADSAPTAEFTWAPDPQDEGSPVQFTDASTSPADAIVSWAWDFADSGSTDQNPSHTFMDDGTYTVSLTVTDDDGSTDTVQHDVTVSDLGPTAAFTSSPEPQVEGTAVAFTDASTSAPDAIASWAWDFDDGGSSTDQNPSHPFMDNGTYTVELTVTDDDGSTDTVQHDVTITDAAPTAAFTSAPEPQVEGSAVQFTDASTSPADAIVSWAWDFDDGGSSTDQNPSHTFMDNGTYTVELTVTDDDGSTDTITHDVTITDAAPTAAFTSAPEPQVEGSAVDFTDASTTPADAIVAWAWVFGDGNTSAAQSPSHVYTDNGTYTVALTVTDEDGSTDTVQHDVTITDAAPTAEFTSAPEPQDEGSAVDFTDASTTPADAIVSWSWDFDNDGVEDSNLQNPAHTFMDDGIYTVTLTVTDDDGSTDTVQHDVTITDGAPTASFTWTPEPQDEGSPVQFTDTSTSPADAIVAWAWDFGDGGTSAVQNPSHIYADNGAYTVTLTVTDDDDGNDGNIQNDYGDSDTIQNTVTIENVPPVVQADPGDLDQTVPGRNPVNISVPFSDAGTADTHTATINWDDGTVEPGVVNEANGSGTVTGSRIYAKAGEFDVVVTIQDDDGGTVAYDIKITVIGIEILSVTFNVLDPTLIVEMDDVADPGLTNFDLMGMEVSDSGNWDYQMSQERGLPIMEQGPSKTLHIDMKRDWINSSQLIRMALEKFFPVDFLARMGAFRDAAGSENIEVTGPDDMRITFVANGLILGTLGDVSGNGVVTAYDAALVAGAVVKGLKTLPIASTAEEVDLLLPGNSNLAKSAADVDKNGDLDSRDALGALRLAAGLGPQAPPDMASEAKKCRLSVNNYDSGKLDVSIDVEDVSGIYCADIVMSYDPGTLTVADVSRTSSVSGWVFADAAESGKLRISMAGLSQPEANGSLVNVSIDAASADAIKELEIIEFKLNGGRARAEIENLPKAFALMPNYPNPFNPETWIPYQLSVPASVTVNIYNLNGQMVRRLELGTRMPGSYVDRSKAVYWDGRNESGEMVSSGIYFYQLQAGRDAAVRKMVIVK